MHKAQRRTFIVGVGTTAYEKPRNKHDYPWLGQQAAVKALLDAGIRYDKVEQAFVGYVYGDSTSGQRALYGLGMTQIPIHNVHNNCASGSSALHLAQTMVAAGVNDCVMALGFDKMQPGSLGAVYHDRTNPLDKSIAKTDRELGLTKGPFNAQLFGNGANAYCEKYGATWRHIGKICNSFSARNPVQPVLKPPYLLEAAKNHNHSVNNPYSQFRNDMTVEAVMNDRIIAPVGMTRAMCCPTSDGGSCAIIASEPFVKSHGLENQAIEITGMALTTDSPRLFDDFIELVGSDAIRRASQIAFKQARITRDNVKVVELHDCFAANELLVYDSLGLCDPGKAHELVDRGDNTYGGKYVINPSGGLESKGHPLGATGIGMAFYLVNQLRGWAGPMQVEGVAPGKSAEEPSALLQNIGLGGACVVAILKRPDFYKSGGTDGRKRLGYNHGCECREATPEQYTQVSSERSFSRIAAA